MDKLTKIVATIGPASDSEESIEKLILSGVNVFRFNFKHSKTDWHNERIERVQKVSNKLKVHVGILLDLQGPELRINMPKDEIHLKEGEEIVLGERVFTDPSVKGIFVSHPQMLPYLKIHEKLIADDGAFTFTVVKTGEKEVTLLSKNKGILKNRKSLRIPGNDFPFPLLIDRDFKGLELAARTKIDYVALSYVRTAEDVTILRKEMKKYSVLAQVISKIETKSSIAHLDEIIKVSDGIMVARGDLGIELPIEEVPYYQKIIIHKSLEHGIPVITATQMLESMMEKPYPTRADVSDIANATYDMTDAVMLSGETAGGHYPVQAVEMMKKTIIMNEKRFITDTRKKFNFKASCPRALICDAAYNLSRALWQSGEEVRGFIVFSSTGQTIKLLSRYRPAQPIFALVDTKKTAEGLTLNFATYPIVLSDIGFKEKFVFIEKQSIQKIISYIHSTLKVPRGRFIMIHGDIWFLGGQTSSVKLIQSQDLSEK